MAKKIKNLIPISLLIALSVNFVLYSSQSYSPPKAESVSYSIVNCPSHEGGHHSSNIIQAILGSESENGAEKDCFCYDCCTQRISPYITTKSFTLTLERYTYYTLQATEPPLSEDSNKNLPIRSPPYKS